MPTVGTVLCGTVTARCGRSRLGLGRLMSRGVKIRDRGMASDDERNSLHVGDLAAVDTWRTKSLDALFPVLYPRGISTGDFQEALAALLGKDAPNLSLAVIPPATQRLR